MKNKPVHVYTVNNIGLLVSLEELSPQKFKETLPTLVKNSKQWITDRIGVGDTFLLRSIKSQRKNSRSTITLPDFDNINKQNKPLALMYSSDLVNDGIKVHKHISDKYGKRLVAVVLAQNKRITFLTYFNTKMVLLHPNIDLI